MIRDILDVATPSMRPLWVGRTKPMTRDETLVLALAATTDGPLPYRRICEVVPGEPWNLLNSLKQQGALDHPGYNRWEITEKGRIAAALAMAKDPTLAEAFS